MSTEAEREAEVEALICKANDPDDPYNGHHGTDRAEESLAYAIAHNPAVAEKLYARLAAAEGDNA